MFTRLKEVKNQKNIDLLILGSSHAYRGFDVRLFDKAGYKAFNLGSSAQTPIQSSFLLKKYINQLNPKTIILEVNWYNFTSDGVESSLDIIANDRNDYSTIKMALLQNHIKVYNTLIYGFYRDIFNRNNALIEEKTTPEDTYISGGYVEKTLRSYKGSKREVTVNQLNPKQLNAFDEIIEMVRSRNIRLVLVQAPVTKLFYNSNKNNKLFDTKMKSIGEYYNFNNKVNLKDSTDFYDDEHLNQIGVTKFNNMLLKIL